MGGNGYGIVVLASRERVVLYKDRVEEAVPKGTGPYLPNSALSAHRRAQGLACRSRFGVIGVAFHFRIFPSTCQPTPKHAPDFRLIRLQES